MIGPFFIGNVKGGKYFQSLREPCTFLLQCQHYALYGQHAKCLIPQEVYLHSEKKRYQNGAPGALLLQMVPFFQYSMDFHLIHNNHTPKATILLTVK